MVRKVCDSDKRVTFIKLTKKGEDLMSEIFPIHKENTKEIFSELTDEEIKTLMEILLRIKR